jgi:MFS family permease
VFVGFSDYIFQFLGSILTAPLAGKLGRKKPVLYALLGWIFGLLGQYFANVN